MKKLLVFLMVIGCISLAYIKTNGFKYLNGQLSDDFSAVLWTVSIILGVAAICYLASGLKLFKNMIDKMPMTPFEKD
jgi:hypothetical protein